VGSGRDRGEVAEGACPLTLPSPLGGGPSPLHYSTFRSILYCTIVHALENYEDCSRYISGYRGHNK
jgi:hypothetical protein